MKKKLLTIFLLFSILLVGCGTSENSSTEDVWEEDTEYEETDTDYEEDIYEEPDEEVLGTYPFTKLRPFSEERAWVNFEKDDDIYTGIIDTDGKLLYQAEGKFFYMSQFEDGTAFYRETSEETSPCGIIDLDGNVLFESEISSDGGYLILAYGNKHFLVAQHIQNFETAEWCYGTINQNGEILNEPTPNERINAMKWMKQGNCYKYIGENLIALLSGLYNVSTANFFPFPYIPFGATDMVIGEFQDGYTVVTFGGGAFNGRSYVIDKNYTDDKEIEFHDNFIDDVPIYNEGLVWVHDVLGYCDKDWNLVISLEQYNDATGGTFRGGYAAVTMIGADGKLYASIIDKNGDLVYSPIKIDDSESTIPNNSSNGYFQVTIDEEEKVIDPDGNLYTLGTDDLSVCEGLTFGDISEGFIMMSSDSNLYYISLDCNTVIDSAKITSTSKYADDISHSDDFSEDDSLGDENEASYIVPNSYDITGKWKSVGSSGVGQAQPGAIIVFDGNNCNFYSPNDTYAFYLDGNRYVLDITSSLGESLSFKVNIIDDDNIDIAGASLQRVK